MPTIFEQFSDPNKPEPSDDSVFNRQSIPGPINNLACMHSQPDRYRGPYRIALLCIYWQYRDIRVINWP